MASRASLIQSRSIYVGTSNAVAPSAGDLVVSGGGMIGVSSQFTFGGTAKLSVYADAPITFALSNTDAVYFRRYGAGQYQFQTTSNGGNTGDLSLQSYGGNVGIGTTSPSTKLDVIGVGAFGTMTSSRGTYSNGLSLQNNTGEATSLFLWQSGVASAHIGSPANSTSLHIVNSYNTGLITDPNSIVLTNTGNVGIGTTNPNEKLQVAGNINAYVNGGIDAGLFASTSAGSTTIALRSNGITHFNGGNVGIGTTAPDAKLVIVTGSTDDSGNSFSFTGYGSKEYVSISKLGFIRTRSSDINGANMHFLDNGGTTRMELAVSTTSMTWYSHALGSTFMVFQHTTGNVGIGTTSPQVKLEVRGAQNNTIVPANAVAKFVGGDAGIFVGNLAGTPNYGAWLQAMRESDGLVFPLHLQPNGGNVGIGTTSPAQKLHVVGNGLYTGNLDVGHSVSTEDTAINLGTGRTGNGFAYIDLIGDTTYTDYGLRIIRNNGGANTTSLIVHRGTGDFSIQNNEAANLVFLTAATERMRITSAGNVGIGTTAPAAILHVSSTGANAYSSTITKGSNMKGIVNTLSNNADDMVGIYFATGTNDAGSHWSGITGSRSQSATDWSTQLNFYTHDENFSNINDATQKMVIKGNGNVGIGTTSPSSVLDIRRNGGGSTNPIPLTSWYGGNGGGNLVAKLEYTADAGIFSIGYAGISSWDSIVLDGGSSNSGSSIALKNDGTTTVFLRSSSGNNYINSGNVGIGTTSPTEKLHVDGSVVVTYNNSYQGINSVGNKAILARVSPTSGIINYAEYATAANLNGFVMGSDDARVKGNIATDSLEFITNGSTRMTVLSSGNVGVNTTTPGTNFHVVGDVLIQTGALGVGVNPNATDGRIDASNDIVAYSSSDRRLKENITPIANALDKVKLLTGVEFDWKPEHKKAHGYEGHDTGVIAQEVQEVMPTAVRTNDTGYLAVRYEKMIGLLIEAMKEQQTQIDELKAKLDGLTK